MNTSKMYDWETDSIVRIFYTKKGEKIRDIKSRISSECYESELYTVSDGKRKCSTVTNDIKRYDNTIKRLSDTELVMVPLQECKMIDGFSHKFEGVEEGKPKGLHCVVSRDFDTAKKFKRAYNNGNSETMGKMLGYPKCCREYFKDVFPEEYDPVWSAALNTEEADIEDNTVYLDEIDPYVNPLLRYFGIKISPNLPCSFDCNKTREFGKKFEEYISNINVVKDILSGPITWSCYKGVLEVRTPWFVGLTNSMAFKDEHKIVIGEEISR